MEERRPKEHKLQEEERQVRSKLKSEVKSKGTEARSCIIIIIIINSILFTIFYNLPAVWIRSEFQKPAAFPQVSVASFRMPKSAFMNSYVTNRMLFWGTTLSVLAAHPL